MNGGTGHKAPDDALRAQLEELGGLRNANARDPVFKAWRQNTLTLIQRVWQMDTSRAERFRRVPFSPPSSKANATVRRQYFERGCSEAIWLLRDWIEDARRNALTFAEAERPSTPAMPGMQEDDFPVLDLPVNGDAPRTAGGSEDAPLVLEPSPMPMMPPAGSPRVPGSPSEKPRPPLVSPFAEPMDLPPADPAPAKPAPPSKAVKPAPAKHAAPKPAAAAKPAAPAKPAPSPEPVAERPAPPSEPAAREPAAGNVPATAAGGDGYEADLDAAFDMFMKGGSDRRARREAKRGAPKRALKDMLGFTDETAMRAGDGPAAHAAPAPAAPPAPDAHEPVEAATPPPGEVSEGEALYEIVSEQPAAPEPPIAFVSPKAGAPDDEPVEFEVMAEDLEAFPSPALPSERAPVAQADPPEPPASRAGAPLPPEPVAGPREKADDDEAAAMQEFLDRSPVLGARPKPAPPRPKPAAALPPAPAPIPMRSATATSLAALAGEAGQLGVPEGQRAAVRAMLLDLARGFDDGRANWDTIRHAVVFAMEYPPLARRVLPLLVPHLDRAA